MGTDCGIAIKKKDGTFIEHDLDRWYHFCQIPKLNILIPKDKMLKVLLDCFIEIHDDDSDDVVNYGYSVRQAALIVKGCDKEDLIGFYVENCDHEESDFKIEL